MKQIEAKSQTNLGSGRCLQLAMSGIMFRLFRSLITVAVLGLAVAFLVHMLAYGVMASASQRAIWSELETQRVLSTQLRRLEVPDPVVTIIQQLQRGAPARMAEYRTWGVLTVDEQHELERLADTLRTFEQGLNRIPDRARAILVGERNVYQLLDYLSREDARATFFERAAQTGTRLPLGDEAAVERLVLEDGPRLNSLAQRIQQGHAQAVRQWRAALGGRPVLQVIQTEPAAVAQAAEAAGFHTATMDFEALAQFARDQEVQRALTDALGTLRVRQGAAREMGVTPGEVTSEALFDWLAASPRRAGAFDALLAETTDYTAIGGAGLQAVAEDMVRIRRLQALVPEEPAGGDAPFGLTPAARWLILLAFAVCVIGVANAMLMSVTERFTEIATMKCLGALDKFVMLMFVFESALQGLAGGLLGVLLGTALAVVRGMAEYGQAVVLGEVTGSIFLAAGLSLGIGVLLAMLAAVGPAYVAARLAPMEAMRVE